MHRDKQFEPLDVVKRDIAEAAEIGPQFRRVFLCDGDALILSTKPLAFAQLHEPHAHRARHDAIVLDVRRRRDKRIV